MLQEKKKDTLNLQVYVRNNIEKNPTHDLKWEYIKWIYNYAAIKK